MTPLTEPPLTACSDPELLAHFLSHPEQGAFAELVRRHGGMVLAVCRSVLRNESDAEDAAQAVFLTLAQKAHGLQGQDTLVGWLHRAAWYVATCAVRGAVLRRHHEQEASRMKPELSQEGENLPLDLLHAELNRLPEKYRLPLLLHHLEGRTQEETAAVLGCKTSAASVRLTRGRQMLRERLRRRGVTAAALGGALILANQAAAGVLLSFVATANQTAVAVISGQAAPISTEVAALSKGALHMLWMEKIKQVAILALIAVLIGGAGLATYVIAADNTGRTAPEKKIMMSAFGGNKVYGPNNKTTGAISGKVVDADGKAVAKATVEVMTPGNLDNGGRGTVVGQANTDADGKFKVGGLVDGNYQVKVTAETRTGGDVATVKDGKETVLENPIIVKTYH